MTDADKIEALLDIVDQERTPNRDRSEKLIVLGYAARALCGGSPIQRVAQEH